MKSLLRPMWAVLVTVTIASCSNDPASPNGNGGNGGGGGGGGPVTVQLNATSFSPATVTIKAGQTVVWQNNGGSHTITPDGHTAWNDVSTSGVEEALRVTFNTPGTYDYYCNPHRIAGMTGRIIVN